MMSKKSEKSVSAKREKVSQVYFMTATKQVSSHCRSISSTNQTRWKSWLKILWFIIMNYEWIESYSKVLDQTAWLLCQTRFLWSLQAMKFLATSTRLRILVWDLWMWKSVKWFRQCWNIVEHRYALICHRALNDPSLVALVAGITSSCLTSLLISDITSNWPGVRLQKEVITVINNFFVTKIFLSLEQCLKIIYANIFIHE